MTTPISVATAASRYDGDEAEETVTLDGGEPGPRFKSNGLGGCSRSDPGGASRSHPGGASRRDPTGTEITRSERPLVAPGPLSYHGDPDTKMVGYFVTGTDTGVGKTYVTSALAERGRQLGRRVFAWKPVETGCTAVNGEWIGADQEAISSDWQQGEFRGLYRFRRPVAPLVAAREEGEIEPHRILETFQSGAKNADLVLVEGAGGWRVPITESLDMGGLARMLGSPVIVVARGSLGTINHTLLTVEAVARDQQQVSAVVLSCKPDDDASFVEENANEIRRRFSGRVLSLWRDTRVLDCLL